jgi:hypothetical protein
LLAVEDAFRTAKALLATRPIYQCCARSCVIVSRRVVARVWNGNASSMISMICEIEVEQDGRRALLRTAPGSTIDPICRALGMSLRIAFTIPA